MATYVTKKCPHCGFAYQVFQSGEQRELMHYFRLTADELAEDIYSWIQRV